MNWDQDFSGLPPIALSDGRQLSTLACCRQFILDLPEGEQARWASPTASLLLAAQHGGPFRMIARITFSRALHGIEGVGPIPEVPDPRAAWRAKRAQHKCQAPKKNPALLPESGASVKRRSWRLTVAVM
jgi:hypothetical protein